MLNREYFAEQDAFEYGEYFAANNFDIIVIGAGPAGLATAITALHEGMSVLLLESTRNVGGNMNNIAYIANLPGVHARSGLKIANTMKAQLEDFAGNRCVFLDEFKVFDIVEFPHLAPRTITVIAEDKRTGLNFNIYGKSVVIATGQSINRLLPGILDEKNLMYEGALSYIHVPQTIPLNLMKDFVFVGSGNATYQAMTELLKTFKDRNRSLSFNFTVLHRSSGIKASNSVIQDFVSLKSWFKESEVSFKTIGCEITSVMKKGNDAKGVIKVRPHESHTDSVIEYDHICVNVGASPKLDWLKNSGISRKFQFDAFGKYVASAPIDLPFSSPEYRLLVDVIGDIRARPTSKRVATAIGQGTQVALRIKQILNERL